MKLWNTFVTLSEELFATISRYLTDNDYSKGKVFKLDICMHEADQDPRIIGIKKIPLDDNIAILVKIDEQVTWEILERDAVEYSDSFSRIDLLMWICDELFTHWNYNSHWVREFEFFPQLSKTC